MKKGNISIFVPHLGCPCKCSFCNQNTITGQRSQPTPMDVKEACDTALKKDGFSYEIAFFGGSFTAIEKNYMVSLLKTAYEYVKSGQVNGIRISTRPDCINEEILDTLKSFGVMSIELGAQSMDDKVLTLNKRGHLSNDVVTSSKLIKDFGFSLGLQMMTGLYGDNDEKALVTAKKLIALKPSTIRIYPTVVLKNTYLSYLYDNEKYMSQTVEDAVSLCANLVPMFEKENIKVIRLGLHSSPDIKENMVSGAFHDSFGELVSSRIMLNKILEYEPNSYTIKINSKSISKLKGNKKSNMTALKNKGYKINIVFDDSLSSDELRIENGTKNT